MKKSMLVALLGAMSFLSSAYASTGETTLMKCKFMESMSVSFGYSSIYTVKGSIRELSLNGPEHFYEVDGPAKVAIDNTASTNFAGRHVADTTATVDNHPSGQKVMIDVTSTESSGPAAFRILVFPGQLDMPNTYQAYRADGSGRAGTCYDVDSRLTNSIK